MPDKKKGGNESSSLESTSAKEAWKRDFYKQISKELNVTQTTPDIPSLSEADKTNMQDHPRWELMRLTFNKSKPQETVNIHGNSSLIPLQISLLSAVKEMLEWERGGRFGDGNIVRRSGNPLIMLFFEEDKPENIESKDFIPVQARISWRLMDYLEYENSIGKEVLTWKKIKVLANKIFLEFQKPNDEKGYLWEKGKFSYNYSDWSNGYGLKIHCKTKEVGKRMLDKILRVNEHNFNDSRASVTTPQNSKDYREGEEIKVLGKKEKKPRFRPVATVRFRKATLELSKVNKPIILVKQGKVWTFPED